MACQWIVVVPAAQLGTNDFRDVRKVLVLKYLFDVFPAFLGVPQTPASLLLYHHPAAWEVSILWLQCLQCRDPYGLACLGRYPRTDIAPVERLFYKWGPTKVEMGCLFDTLASDKCRQCKTLAFLAWRVASSSLVHWRYRNRASAALLVLPWQ